MPNRFAEAVTLYFGVGRFSFRVIAETCSEWFWPYVHRASCFASLFVYRRLLYTLYKLILTPTRIGVWLQHLPGVLDCLLQYVKIFIQVFLNRRAAARYRALASIIPGRERSEETTICYKISLVQLITNLNVILYLSTCHTVYISVLILFMIMP